MSLGVPVPKEFRVAPTAEAAKAKVLLAEGKADEARAIYKEIIDNEDYCQMKAEDAIGVLAGYADCIKRALHVLTTNEWREVCRALEILVCEYAQPPAFDQEFRRDLAAAKRQVEKLERSMAQGDSETAAT